MQQVVPLLTLSILAPTLLIALLKGGSPERWGTLLVLVSFVIQLLSRLVRHQIYYAVDPVSVIVDLFLLVNFGTLAVYANRMWPIWAASLQILSLSAHFARIFNLGLSELVYGVMKGVPTLTLLLALAIGTFNHRKILRSKGFDRDWKDWSTQESASNR